LIETSYDSINYSFSPFVDILLSKLLSFEYRRLLCEKEFSENLRGEFSLEFSLSLVPGPIPTKILSSCLSLILLFRLELGEA